MRWIVYGLAALVALKLYTQYYLYQQATEEALMAAYSDKALAACRASPTDANLSPNLWTRAADIQIEVGRDDLGVAIWETNHALWKAANAQIYLRVSPAARNAGVSCIFDPQTGAATVQTTS